MRTDVTYYETRPYSWNCSCPAFIFSAFTADGASNEREIDSIHLTTDEEHSNREGRNVDGRVGTEGKRSWMAGGLTTGTDVPVCKHLLACVLVEHCANMFGHFVKQRDVSIDEMVAWGAGWGG